MKVDTYDGRMTVRIYSLGIRDEDTLNIRMVQARLEELVKEFERNGVDVEWITDDMCLSRKHEELEDKLKENVCASDNTFNNPIKGDRNDWTGDREQHR